MYVTCAAEVLLGAIVVLRPAKALITWFQIALITGFTGILAVYEPLLLANPFGMLSKKRSTRRVDHYNISVGSRRLEQTQ